MPALNAGSPNPPAANPSTGVAILMSSFSGPKGSPFDKDNTGNFTTGALNTGIGAGIGNGLFLNYPPSSAVAGYQLGVTKPDLTDMAATDPGTGAPWGSTLVAIGGGRTNVAASTGVTSTVPYGTGFAIVAFGNGGSRDATAGPAFQGFGLRYSSPQTATVATGGAFLGAITNLVNRTGVAIVATAPLPLSAFGSMTTASGAIT